MKNLSAIKQMFTSTSAMTMLRLQKNAPTILFAGGVVGVVGAAVLASRATLKLEGVLDEIEENKKQVLETEHHTYSESDRRQDLFIVKVQGVQSVVKLYAPAVIVGGLSILALTRSHQILMQRNTALMAAYAAIDKGFKEYRARVVEELGEEKDLEFRHGTVTVSELKADAEGNTSVVEKTVLNPSGKSIYSKFFDEQSHNWKRDPDYNYIFLSAQQEFANHRLRARGYLILNEVYESLGLPLTSAGALVGWIYDPEDDTRDNYVDFGLYSGSERSRAFVNGPEKSILLDFNVDGVVYDQLDKISGENVE